FDQLDQFRHHPHRNQQRRDRLRDCRFRTTTVLSRCPVAVTLVRSNSFVRAGGSKISIAAKERRTQREDRSWTLTNRNLRCELGELASGNTASVAIESHRRMWPEFSWRRESRRSTSIPPGRTPSIPRPRGCSHVRVFPL